MDGFFPVSFFFFIIFWSTVFYINTEKTIPQDRIYVQFICRDSTLWYHRFDTDFLLRSCNLLQIFYISVVIFINDFTNVLTKVSR